jgi:peroxiredoxin
MRLYLITLIGLLLFACSDNNFIIEGKVTNSRAEKIYLEKLELNGSTPYDSAKINNDGHFTLKGKVSHPTFFILKLNKQKFITLLVDSAEQVSFSADFLNFSRDYKVEGSLGSEKVKILNDKLTVTNLKIDSITSLISLCSDNNDYDEQYKKWISELEDIYIAQQDFSKQFIQENPFSLASVLAIYQKFNSGEYVLQDIQTLKMAASALHSMYPQSIHASQLYRDTEKLVNEIRTMEINEYIATHGSNSPEITLPDHKGEEIKLSSLRGKYVLVHFWSANDKTSRITNEVLAENYALFNKKDFEIYQVSIDTNRDQWLTAIEDDKLHWINVADLRGSSSAVNAYNIQSIPSNYLLNKEGEIVAKDLRGPAIYKKLNEILNQ